MAPRIRYAVFSVLLATALVWLAATARGPLLRRYAEHLAEALPAASEDRVETTLDKIARLGQPGLPVLLKSMESPREIVALGAAERVFRRAERWERGAPSETDAPLADLIVRLAERADAYPHSIRKSVRELALRVLRRPMMHARRPRVEVFAACDRLLQEPAVSPETNPANRDAERESISGRPDSDDEKQVAESPHIRQAADWQSGVIRNVASLPGGGLDYSPASERPNRVTANTPRSLDAADSHPGSLPANPSAASLAIPAGEAAGRKESAVRSVSRSASGADPKDVGDTFSLFDTPGESKSSEPAPVAELPKPRIYEVMRTFASGPEALAEEAESQLRDCGFQAVHFRLAKRLFHADPEIRRTLAKVLPDIPGVRAETWLLYLCHDREAAVRETALGMLLTLDNPAVIREARRITDAVR